MKKISLALLTLGGLIRLAGLTASDAWLDELLSLYRSRLPLAQLLHLSFGGTHSPVWEGLLHFVTIVWPSVMAGRIIAVACSLAALYVAWLIMDRLDFDDWQRLFSSALIAFLPGLLWMSQDARLYALFTLLYLLSILLALRSNLAGVAITGLVLIALHATGAAFALGTLVIYYLSDREKIGDKEAITCSVATGLGWSMAMAPILLPMVLRWRNSGYLPAFSINWLGNQLIQAFIALPVPSLMWMTVIFLVICIAFDWERHLILNGIWLVPLGTLIILSFVISNVITYRVFSVLVAPMSLWIGHAFTPRRAIYTWLTPVIAAVVLIIGLIAWDPAIRGGHISQAANIIKDEWSLGDHIIYGTDTAALPFDYALHDRPDILSGCIMLQLEPGYWSEFGLNQCVDLPHGRVWLIFPNDPLIDPVTYRELEALAKTGMKKARVIYPQTASIEVYLLEEK